MEHFIVSARKYRPTQFDEVVGQQAITKTLNNAIENNHLSQALLFTGPRGVGKTTCARILAKKINDDGTYKADEDFAFNIFELDAASNNSVDDIRNLIDQVRIPPQVGSYKVYIIDEVHMLSSAAFNAFLKTLEEPPKHAIFILATTEKHKIIPTILSRCQIFDFRRITVQDIKEQLAFVAKQEGIDAEDDALHIIAQKADGALRDALSIFDRVVSFTGKSITREAVAENLNVLDYSYYFKMTELLVVNDIPNALLTYNDILAKGFDGHHFITGLASHLRDLLVCKDSSTVTLLEVGEQLREEYQRQSDLTSAEFLKTAIDLATKCELNYKSSSNQRLLVELCLLQLASITATSEKKKSRPSQLNEIQVIPPSFFKIKTDPSKKEPIVETVTDEEVVEEDQEDLPQTPDEPVVDHEPTVIERPRIVAERNAKKVSALSLKSIQKKQQLKRELVAAGADPANLPEEEFSENEMIDAWKDYTSKVEAEGKFNLLSHLTMGTPKLEGTLIHLVFPNSTIKVEVERAKSNLLSYLRKRLKNHTIDLSIEVNEDEQKRYAYTAREKYEQLLEKNPLIDKLRSKFDLEI